jgi:hypothetical protein|tara:strand:+ start:250 stop:351 length:102 start_codon:yes stop_codon:yes gene_type:complete
MLVADVDTLDANVVLALFEKTTAMLDASEYELD